ncbi:MAG: rod shape-determining protein MreD [Eggerthellaceae bacterium]|nr:rod shape-determining protein MreD [Eggerthellaceae bacterium]
MGIQVRLILGALIAIIFQIVVAPNIAILGAQPNFIVVYIIVISMIHPSDTTLVLAFISGLIFDALAQQPFGIMAFILVVSAFLFGRIYDKFTSNNIAVPLVVAMLCSLLVEVLSVGAYTEISATTPEFFSALIHTALPNTLYDSAAVLLVMPLLVKSLQGSDDAPAWGKGL